MGILSTIVLFCSYVPELDALAHIKCSPSQECAVEGGYFPLYTGPCTMKVATLKGSYSWEFFVAIFKEVMKNAVGAILTWV